MKRLPTPERFQDSINHSIAALEAIRRYGPELLRRREHDAGRDGYPSSSMGGGSSGQSTSSTTENAALARPEIDPIGRSIDDIISRISSVDHDCTVMTANLARVLQVESEMRGRIATVEQCEACEATITGIGDDRSRSDFCPKCYRSWLRWKEREGRSDPGARDVFIHWRRQTLREQKSA